jgi:hypothetical protein
MHFEELPGVLHFVVPLPQQEMEGACAPFELFLVVRLVTHAQQRVGMYDIEERDIPPGVQGRLDR